MINTPAMKVVEVEAHCESSEEQTLIVKAGSQTVAVFAYQSHQKAGDVVTEPLETLFTENMRISFAQTPSVRRINNGFEHAITAQVVKLHGTSLSKRGLLSADGLIFDVDAVLPGDIKEGDFVEFECMRVDLPCFLPETRRKTL